MSLLLGAAWCQVPLIGGARRVCVLCNLSMGRALSGLSELLGLLGLLGLLLGLSGLLGLLGLSIVHIFHVVANACKFSFRMSAS